MNRTRVIQIVALIVVLISAIAVSFAMFSDGGDMYIPVNDDFDKLGNAYIKSSSLKSYESEQSVKYELIDIGDEAYMSDEQEQMLKDLFNGISFNLSTKKAVLSGKDIYSGNVDLFVDNASFVKADYYIDDNMIVLELPGLYAKKAYLKWEDLDDLVRKANSEITEEINIEDYKKLFAKNNLGKLKNIKGLDYYQIIKDNLKDNLTVKEKSNINVIENGEEKAYLCDTYDITVEQSEFLQLTLALMDKLINDENFKGFVKDKVNEVVDTLIRTEDYKLFEAKLEDLQKFKEEFNRDFDTKYQEFVKDFKTGYEEGMNVANTQDALQGTVKYVFAIDSDSNIRKVEAEQLSKTQGVSLKLTTTGTIANPNGEVLITAPDVSEAINLAEATEEQLQEIGQQIVMSVAGKAMMSPSIQKIMLEAQQSYMSTPSIYQSDYPVEMYDDSEFPTFDESEFNFEELEGFEKFED